jgi:RNA polymerase sigma-70 factor (ECF subfamily)
MTRNPRGTPLLSEGEDVSGLLVSQGNLPLPARVRPASRPSAAAEAPAGAIDARIQAAAAGDRAAAQALLLSVLPRVRNLVRYLVRGDSETDDLAQEALIAILRGLGGFRGESSFERWADRVAVRATFAGLRRRRRESNDLVTAAPDLRLASPDTALPDDYTDRRRAAALLDALPPDQRHAVVMHHILGMSVPEIARELGIPAETVRSRLRLARTRLRELGMSTTDDGEDDDAADKA